MRVTACLAIVKTTPQSALKRGTVSNCGNFEGGGEELSKCLTYKKDCVGRECLCECLYVDRDELGVK